MHQVRASSLTGRGFTLTELMVSVAVLMIAMLAVGYIFTSVSKTSGITTGTIELTDTIETMRQTMQADLDAMAPGILIIDSPNPERVSPEQVYVPDAIGEYYEQDNPDFAPRRDRLVFLTSTAPGTYQSWVDPNKSSGEAVLCYGHGSDPAYDVDLDDVAPYPIAGFTPNVGYANQRILCRRVILLGLTDVSLEELPLDEIDELFFRGEDDAVQETLSDLLVRLRDIENGDIRALWRRNSALAGVSTDDALSDYYYSKHCFQFLPRVGDFIVEWTDGAIASEGGRLWYGLERETPDDVVEPYDDPLIDQFDPTDTDDYPGYRAVWRVDGDTWHLRPKALRITVRLYDANKRILDADERLGRESSFILQVP